jgi:hypothetical protein
MRNRRVQPADRKGGKAYRMYAARAEPRPGRSKQEVCEWKAIPLEG